MIDIQSLNKRVEKERKNASLTATILIIINAFAVIFFFTQMFSSTNNASSGMSSMVFMVIGLMVPIGISMFVYRSVRSKYVTKVKDIIYEEVFKVQFEDTHFDPNGGISISTLSQNRIVDTADRQSTNDYLSGRFENVPFTRCDVHTESSSTDSDGNTTYTTIFKGQVYSFNFNKDNRSRIRVVEKGFLKSFKIFNRGAVELENTRFNELFSVTSDDAHDVFYVFTPHFMDKYLDLHRKLDGKTCMVIIGGQLYLAINNHRDSFEPGMGELGAAFQNSLEQDINIIKTIIHDLDLTNTLFQGPQA